MNAPLHRICEDAPKVPDEVLERLAEIYLKRLDLQEYFRSFECFVHWWMSHPTVIAIWED